MTSFLFSNDDWWFIKKCIIISFFFCLATSRPSSKRFYFLAKPETRDVKLGESFILQAFVDSDSPVEYIWYKDDQRIQMGTSKSIVGQGNLKVLFADTGDAGTYKVMVRSSGRSLTASASVKIMCKILILREEMFVYFCVHFIVFILATAQICSLNQTWKELPVDYLLFILVFFIILTF